ncbi:hypothetical protein BgiMline_021042, partial [Biomphalaria glabrata]
MAAKRVASLYGLSIRLLCPTQRVHACREIQSYICKCERGPVGGSCAIERDDECVKMR